MPTILVVDDDSTTCALIKAMFRNLAVEVVTVGDGETGLQLARQDTPDVIVMDLLLPEPGIDGLEAIRQIKGDSQLRQIPVVAITAGDAGFGDEQRVYDAGCDGYVLKPFEPNSFRQYLCQFFELRD